MYRVTIKGRGEFPMDMLRYDQAVPGTTGDANAIGDTFRDLRMRMRWTVVVITPRFPTVARWASFGPIVTEVLDDNGEDCLMTAAS